MNGLAASNKPNPAYQLAGLTVLLVLMYMCTCTLRFTNTWLNLAFVCLFLLVPVLAIALALRLRRGIKVLALVIFIPMGAISLLGFLMLAIFEIPAAAEHRQLSRPLGVVVQQHYSVRLSWDESAGGALGPHGIELEQRMTLFPGLYAFKSLDYFESATEGSISPAGPDKVRLHIPHTAGNPEVDRVYALKSWLYF